MKRNIFIKAMLSFAVILPLSSCNVHIHASENYKYDDEYHWKTCDECGEEFDKEKHQFVSDENGEVCSICNYHLGSDDSDLFSSWAKVRDRMLASDKYIYTVDSILNLYDDNGQIYSSQNEYSSRNYNAFFVKRVEGKLNYGINVFRTVKRTIDVVKPVEIDGKSRMKLCQSTWDIETDKTIKKGYIVSPKYASEHETTNLEKTFKDYYLDSGNTLDEFTKNFKNNIFGEASNIFEIKSEMYKERGYYSLKMNISGTYVDSDNKNENYENTKDEYVIEFKMYEENVCHIDLDYTSTGNLKNGNKNSTRTGQFIVVQNAFEEDAYDSYDMTTDETTNAYYVPVNYYLNDYIFEREIGLALYDEVFKAETAQSFLIGCSNFIIDVNNSGISRSTSFNLYSDKNFYSPLNDEIVLNDEINVFIKPDYSKGGYVQLVLKDSYGSYKTSALLFVENGKTFSTSMMSEEYKIVSVDGKAVSEVTSIDIKKNRTYIVVYEKIIVE